MIYSEEKCKIHNSPEEDVLASTNTTRLVKLPILEGIVPTKTNK